MRFTETLPLLRERVESMLREIGTLLLAFTPLDAVLWGERSDRVRLMLTFLLAGIAFIMASLVSETRRGRG